MNSGIERAGLWPGTGDGRFPHRSVLAGSRVDVTRVSIASDLIMLELCAAEVASSWTWSSVRTTLTTFV